MIAYFASDLVWATRIKGLASDLGIEARPVRSIEMLDARLADSRVRGLVVDLDAPETALALIERLRTWERHRAEQDGNNAESALIRVVAFGPHVETASLEMARRLGADVVMTRGGFHQRLPEVLQMLENGEA